MRPTQMKWALRIVSLVAATISGIGFLASLVILLLNYNFEHHRFVPFVVEDGYVTHAMWWGLGLLGSVFIYVSVVRNMRPHSK